VFHLAVVAFVLDADTLGGAAVLIWVPAAVITAVHWSQLRLRREEAVGEGARALDGPAPEPAEDLVRG